MPIFHAVNCQITHSVSRRVEVNCVYRWLHLQLCSVLLRGAEVEDHSSSNELFYLPLLVYEIDLFLCFIYLTKWIA